MVTNYIQDNCKYRIPKLDDVVFLVGSENLGNALVDNGEAFMYGVTSSWAVHMPCYSLTLAESETLDERYTFEHSITFTVNGYSNVESLDGRFYAILKDLEGNYWIMNPSTKANVKYVYTAQSDKDYTTFTISALMKESKRD